MITAHARMADAVRANDLIDADGDGIAAQVGIVYNLEATSPKDPANRLDIAGAANLSYIINQVFLNGAINGDVDADFTGQTVHRDDLAGRTDFLGVNYYDRAVVEGLSQSPFPQEAPYATFNPFTLQLKYDASGISEVLELARGWNLPIYISETGTTDPADDGSGARWVAETLTRVKRAINVGIPVRGYFYWTLMDNYEWNHGMSLRFGLFGVDKTDPAKTRTPRPRIIDAFSRIAKSGRIPDDLITPP